MTMKKSDIRDVTIRTYPTGQPTEPSPPDADSVQTSPEGQAVPFPSGADMTSAGGAKSTDTWAQITGSKVNFPPASDTTSAGGVHDTDSWAEK